MSDARNDIINLFQKGIFPYKDNIFKTKEKELEEQLEEESEKESFKKCIEYIDNESKGINYDLFKKHFSFVVPNALVKQLHKTKNKKENNKLVNVKDEIKEMSEDEIENEKPDKILKIVEKILDFNKIIRKQQCLGLKILTPNQMLSRLPIDLAQLKAGNNSENLKNEIRQLLYSLYRSKKLTKQLYKSLVDII